MFVKLRSQSQHQFFAIFQLALPTEEVTGDVKSAFFSACL